MCVLLVVNTPCCGTRCSSRGLTADQLIASIRIATIHELAAATVRSDKVISF
jgi:sulfur relay (sulfurtransferase) complex TusBCD TusD component (DsrE family)